MAALFHLAMRNTVRCRGEMGRVAAGPGFSEELPQPHNRTTPHHSLYDSVKIVITDANEDDITHSIFYTAVTRSRESLRIFWTPETQQSVLKSIRRGSSPKDVALLSSRRGLMPTAGSRRVS
ncbi:hypothetical protein GCM10022224_089540 [Nonomuraea antimicrobica]|uniref:UvrD-like helicase C-terminal domain-containing protein n=1 Tax=Nonomuraea antimicrobica TaxID=561173 RepID=A0ABP7DTL3_9ACTN